MAQLVHIIWYAEIVLKGLAAYRLFPRLSQIPAIWAWIVISALRSIALAYVQDDQARYLDLYSYSVPLILCLQGFVVVEIFWLLAERLKNFRTVGQWVLSLLAWVATVTAGMTHLFGIPESWKGLGAGAMLVERHAFTAMTLMLLVFALLQWYLDALPVERFARRACYIFGIHSILLALINAFSIATDGSWPRTSYAMPVVAGLLAAALLALWLPSAGAEKIDEDVPPVLTDEEEAAELERIARGICGVVSWPEHRR